MELRLGDTLEMLDNSFDLGFVQESALSTNQIARAGLEEEHVTLAEKRFGTVLVQDDPAVHPGGHAESAALELAKTLARRGPVAVREAKAVLNTTLDGSLAEGQADELEASKRVFSSGDMLEGAAAFVEKRPPRFLNQ